MKHAISLEIINKKAVTLPHKRNKSQINPQPLIELPSPSKIQRRYESINKKLTTRYETIDRWKLKYTEGTAAIGMPKISHSPEMKKVDMLPIHACSVLELPRLRQTPRFADGSTIDSSPTKNSRSILPALKHLAEGQSHPEMVVTQKQLSIILKRREITRINRQTVRQLRNHDCFKKPVPYISPSKINKVSVLDQLIDEQLSSWNNEQQDQLPVSRCG